MEQDSNFEKVFQTTSSGTGFADIAFENLESFDEDIICELVDRTKVVKDMQLKLAQKHAEMKISSKEPRYYTQQEGICDEEIHTLLNSMSDINKENKKLQEALEGLISSTTHKVRTKQPTSSSIITSQVQPTSSSIITSQVQPSE